MVDFQLTIYEFQVTRLLLKLRVTFCTRVTSYSLLEKCSYLEFFWYVFSHIWTDYTVRIRENTDLKNSKWGHFSCSDYLLHKLGFNFYVLVTSYARVTS